MLKYLFNQTANWTGIFLKEKKKGPVNLFKLELILCGIFFYKSLFLPEKTIYMLKMKSNP